MLCSELQVFIGSNTATPFFANLSESGGLDYPLFGLSLTRDASGTLTFGEPPLLVILTLSDNSVCRGDRRFSCG